MMAHSKYEYIDVFVLKDEEGQIKGVTFTNEYASKLSEAAGYSVEEKTVEARWFDELLEDVFAHGRYMMEL